jgi:hypothetical protein
MASWAPPEHAAPVRAYPRPIVRRPLGRPAHLNAERT